MENNKPLIRKVCLDALHDFEPSVDFGKAVMGASPAKFSGEENAVYIVRGFKVLFSYFWESPSLKRSMELLEDFIERFDVDVVRIDGRGTGSGVYNNLRHDSKLNSRENPEIEYIILHEPVLRYYATLGEEMMFKMSGMIQGGNLGPIDDEKTINQLLSLTTTVDYEGRYMCNYLKVESNRAQALAMASYVDTCYMDKIREQEEENEKAIGDNLEDD